MERVDRVGKAIPFTVTFFTCDMERQKGGERITWSATLCSPGGKRKAYHNRNDVRNIKTPNAEHPVGIHPLLITKFNGAEVYI